MVRKNIKWNYKEKQQKVFEKIKKRFIIELVWLNCVDSYCIVGVVIIVRVMIIVVKKCKEVEQN